MGKFVLERLLTYLEQHSLLTRQDGSTATVIIQAEVKIKYTTNQQSRIGSGLQCCYNEV